MLVVILLLFVPSATATPETPMPVWMRYLIVVSFFLLLFLIPRRCMDILCCTRHRVHPTTHGGARDDDANES